MTTLDDIPAFQQSLIDWFRADGKDYPWRRTNDPWAILVSEIMLQQTQIATVLGKGFYVRFMERFPTPADIAVASEQEILSAWEGLGYYRRVRNLQKAAQAICEEHGGVFPTNHEDILKLPGIGRYTAGAVASFAYNQSQAIVDANVARVLARVFDYQERVDSSKGLKQLWAWADALVSPDAPRIYNSALMELGQRVCTNKVIDCDNCPIQPFCQAKKPASLPIKKQPKKTVLVEEHCFLAVDPSKGILLQQADAKARRSGMWKLPERDAIALEKLPLLHKSSYAITHHKVSLFIYDTTERAIPKASGEVTEQWHPISSLDTLPMPSPFRKAVTALLKDLV